MISTSLFPAGPLPELRIPPTAYRLDDGRGDYNRSYDRRYDDFDYADYSTDHRDNNFRTQEKKKRKSKKEIIEDILNRWD